MNFRQFLMIYISTLQKEVHNRMLIVTFVLSLVFIIVGGLSYNHFLENEVYALITKDFSVKVFFTLLLGWSSFLTTIFAVGCLRSDIESRTLPQFLAFPVKRWEYLGARVLGVVSIIVIYNCLILALGVLAFGPVAVSPQTVTASLLLKIPVFISLTIWGVFFSQYFSQIISWILIHIVVLITALSSIAVKNMAAQETWEADFLNISAQIIYWVFPHNSIWSGTASSVLSGSSFSSLDINLGFESAHYLVSTLVLFSLLAFSFRRREI